MPAIITTAKRTHLLDVTTGLTACGFIQPRGYRGEHVGGRLLPAITCGSCRRTRFAQDLAEAWDIKRARERRQEVASATAYVQSRFFPPLPPEYGLLAVQAVQAHEDGDLGRLINVAGLEPQPRAARNGYIRAHELLDALRLDHMIDDEV